MEEITVTATKSERSTFDTPAAVSVIDRQEIEALQPQAITDLLRYQPGVDIGNGPLRITERPFIRGLGGNRLLLSVDGARLNFNTAHGGNLNFIDVESLERLEIVRGPASALYGSSALGGVISLRTKDPRDMLESGQRIGARLQSSFNSANQEFAQHVSLYGIAKDDFDYMLSYTRRDASDVRTAEYTLDNSIEVSPRLCRGTPSV
jgi:hemoglobin/transferrin/lactoferrin receptor protein